MLCDLCDYCTGDLAATFELKEVTQMTKTSKTLITAARIGLGALFLFSGLNGLFHFAPNPPMPQLAQSVMGAMAGSGYFLPLMKVVELACGLLLVTGRLVPLALAALAAVVVNIAAFHLFLAPQGLPIAAFMLVAGMALAWRYREAFRPLLRARPGGGHAIGERALGAVFLLSGIAGLLDHTPPPSTAGAAALMAGLRASGYFLPFISGVQVVAGALLLARRYVPLALAALAPLMVEILAYRLWVHTPGMLLVVTAMAACYTWLVWNHRASFAGLLPIPRLATVS
jgi:uncharacterized membrane protein YphA (DoxX/SURF4 family)